MTPEAVFMLIVATVTVWGGFVAAIVNLNVRGTDND